MTILLHLPEDFVGEDPFFVVARPMYSMYGSWTPMHDVPSHYGTKALSPTTKPKNSIFLSTARAAQGSSWCTLWMDAGRFQPTSVSDLWMRSTRRILDTAYTTDRITRRSLSQGTYFFFVVIPSHGRVVSAHCCHQLNRRRILCQNHLWQRLPSISDRFSQNSMP